MPANSLDPTGTFIVWHRSGVFQSCQGNARPNQTSSPTSLREARTIGESPRVQPGSREHNRASMTLEVSATRRLPSGPRTAATPIDTSLQAPVIGSRFGSSQQRSDVTRVPYTGTLRLRVAGVSTGSDVGWKRRRSADLAALSRSVHIGSVLDPKDGDGLCLVVYLVDDAIGTSSRGPESRQFTLQRVTDPWRVLAQWPDHEFHDCSSDAVG